MTTNILFLLLIFTFVVVESAEYHPGDLVRLSKRSQHGNVKKNTQNRLYKNN